MMRGTVSLRCLSLKGSIMRAGRTLVAVCALGLAGSALAADYPEERGVVPSVIPPAPDEAGIVRSPPRWEDQGTPVTPAAQGGDIDAYFVRYDANRDGV